MALASAGLVGCSDPYGTVSQAITVQPNREVSEPQAVENVRLQAEPAVSFFGTAATPRFVSCGVDTAQRDVQMNTAWSGVTCHLENPTTGQFDTHVAVRNQEPWPASDGFTDGHVSLVRDPGDNNLIWITMVVNWDTIGWGRRRSLGIGRLSISSTGSLLVQDGDLSPNRTPNITQILRSEVEMTADNGSGPFYPTLLIHPTADPNTGLRQQYIVFLQRDGTVSKRKERVGIVRRDMNHTHGWFDAQFIQPAAIALPPDASQWSNDGNEWDNIGTDEMRFSRPMAALRADGSAIGIAFLRLSYSANTSGELVNGNFISQPIRHFHAEYDTNATTWGATGNVTSLSMPLFQASSITEGSINGSEDRRFTALPYDPIVPLIGDTVNRWQIALATNRTVDTNNVAINWRYGTVTVKNISSYGEWREATVFASPAQSLLTSVFPSFVSYRLAAPASTPTYTLAFMGRLSGEQSGNLHALTTTQGAGLVWPSADTLTNASSPAVGTVPWLPGSANGTTDFAWTGHWAGKPNLHYFGTFTGLVAAEGNLFFAWTDSRRFASQDWTKHHESIFGTRFTNP